MFTRLIALSLALVLPAAVPVSPDEGPVFGNPTLVTNPWVAFVPGAVRVLNGRADGVRTTSVVTHLDTTRSFDHGGQPVACRILEEKDFENGTLVEISLSYLAQDDAGNVRAFGEVSLIITDGVVTGAEPDSWLVGGPSLPGDPPEAQTATGPAMYMPATLNVGDTFDQQNLPGSSETIVVVAVDVKVKVPGGKFGKAVKLHELDDGEDDDSGKPEIRWVVPGIGIVKEKGKGLSNQLIATSLKADESAAPGP